MEAKSSDKYHHSNEQQDEEKHHEFDDVFGHVRSLSKYQLILFICNSLMIYSINGQFNVLLFPMATPPFQCSTPNVTCPVSRCCDNCTSYVFDGSFTSTVTEWNLICDRAYLGATLRSCYFVGMLVGSLTVGMLSDAWGRKKSMLLNYTIMLICGTALSFVDCFSLYALLQFVAGYSVAGCMLPNYVYFMEIVGPKRRTVATCWTSVFWDVSWIIHILLAYAIRDWRHLILSYILPGVILLPMWKFAPETPRWLLAHGRLDEANAVLKKFGPKKGKQYLDADALRTLTEDVRKAQLEKERNKRVYTPIDVVRTPKLRKWSIILMYHW